MAWAWGVHVASSPLSDSRPWASAGPQDALLGQLRGLEGAVKASRERLQALIEASGCAQAGTAKTCTQLADLGATLESSQDEILNAASILTSLVPGDPLPLKVLGHHLGLPL